MPYNNNADTDGTQINLIIRKITTCLTEHTHIIFWLLCRLDIYALSSNFTGNFISQFRIQSTDMSCRL